MSARAPLSARDRRALLWGALIAAPVLINVVAVRPYVAALSGTHEAVARERGLLQRELTLLAHAPELPAEIAKARRESAGARARLFAGYDAIEATSALSSYVGNALRGASVNVSQVESRDAASAAAGLREVSIDVRAEGSLDGVLRGLRALESGGRLLRITRVSVERSQAIGGGESLALAVTVRGYARIGE
jgi:type II secretory pathway component PulM